MRLRSGLGVSPPASVGSLGDNASWAALGASLRIITYLSIAHAVQLRQRLEMRKRLKTSVCPSLLSMACDPPTFETTC